MDINDFVLISVSDVMNPEQKCHWIMDLLLDYLQFQVHYLI